MLDCLFHKNEYTLYYNKPTTDEEYCKEPDETIKEMIKTFEEKIKREIIEVYEDEYNWLLYTRPKDGGLNFSPYYKYNKMSGDITFISEMESSIQAWGMLENKIYTKHDEPDLRGPYALEYEAMYITSTYYDDIFKLCDTAFEIERFDTVVCEGSREELGTKLYGYIAKGIISKNDELEIINCDGRIIGKVSAAYVDIRPEGNMKMEPDNDAVWVFILMNLYDDCYPVYLVKASEDKREQFIELLERVHSDVKDTMG